MLSAQEAVDLSIVNSANYSAAEETVEFCITKACRNGEFVCEVHFELYHVNIEKLKRKLELLQYTVQIDKPPGEVGCRMRIAWEDILPS